MIANDYKCHLILSSPEEDEAIQMEESRRVKNKAIHRLYKLKFDTHVDTVCKKAHRKITSLSRITSM